MKPILEIACFDLNSAFIAADNGADRIEFCANYSIGGVTPDLIQTKELINKVTIPVFVMLRIREGFHSIPGDKEVYLQQIEEFKSIGVSGFVIGFLNNDNSIDEKLNQELLNAIRPLPCTFHRAIDYTPNYFNSLEWLKNTGFNRVLTSGGPGNAADYMDQLKKANELFGEQLIILPGGGIRSTNILTLKKFTGCLEFHSAAIVNGKIDSKEVQQLHELIRG